MSNEIQRPGDNTPNFPLQESDATSPQWRRVWISALVIMAVIATSVISLALINRAFQRGWHDRAFERGWDENPSLDNCHPRGILPVKDKVFVVAWCFLGESSGFKLEELVGIELSGKQTIYPIHSTITDLKLDSQGRVWVVTRDEGLTVINPDDTLQTYSTYSTITDLKLDSQGRAWVATHDKGLTVIDSDGTIQTYTTMNSGLVSDNVQALAVDQKGDIWAGTDKGLSMLNVNGQWETYPLELVEDSIWKLLVDPQGRLWMLEGGEYSLSVLDTDGQWVTYETQRQPMEVESDRQGRIWVGYWGGGVSVFEENGNWKSYTTSNSGLGNNFITSLATDQQGRVWLGTNEGMSMLDSSGHWITFTSSNSGLPDINEIQVYKLTIDQQGRVWVGDNGVFLNPREALSATNWALLETARVAAILGIVLVVILWLIILLKQLNLKLSKWVAMLVGAIIGPIASEYAFSALFGDDFDWGYSIPLSLLGGALGSLIGNRIRSNGWGAIIGGALGGIIFRAMVTFILKFLFPG